MLAAEDVRSVEMGGDDGAARVIVSESTGRAVFLARGCNSRRRVWSTNCGSSATDNPPAGLFQPDCEGATVQVLA